MLIPDKILKFNDTAFSFSDKNLVSLLNFVHLYFLRIQNILFFF